MVRDLLKIVLKKLDSLKLLQENGFIANGHILRLDVSKVFSEDQNTKRKTTGQEREIKLEIISAVVCVYNNILGEKLHERLPGIMFKFTVSYLQLILLVFGKCKWLYNWNDNFMVQRDQRLHSCLFIIFYLE